MSLAFVILGAGCVSYGAAFLLHVLSFAEIWKGGRRAGSVMLQAGFLLGTLYFLSQGFQSGYFLPVVNMSAALAFFSWALAFVYLARTALRCAWKAPGQWMLCAQYAVHVHLQKIPALFGQLKWRQAARQHAEIALVDYKK